MGAKRRKYTDEVKKQAHALRLQGLTYEKIAAAIGVSRNVVYGWLNKEKLKGYESNRRPQDKKKRREWVRQYKQTLEGRCKFVLTASVTNARKRGHLPILNTWQELAAELEKQDFTCKITGIAEKDLPVPLHADHDHATGRFRGWISSFANTGLGHFDNSPEWLRAAANYLDA